METKENKKVEGTRVSPLLLTIRTMMITRTVLTATTSARATVISADAKHYCRFFEMLYIY